MNAIESAMGWLGEVVSKNLPKNWISDLLVNGVLAGLGGILVFVPQIMILFGLITLLEDTGYMARISFLSDRIMRRVGLNGKKVAQKEFNKDIQAKKLHQFLLELQANKR